MSEQITRKAFDYNALNDKATRATLRTEATAIKAAVKRTHDNIVEIGTRLIHAKELLEHGEFQQWIEGEFGMGYDMAWNFMNASKRFSKIDFNQLLGLPQTAIFALARPAVDDETRAVALEMAASGDLKTTRDAKDLIEAAKPPKSAETAPDEPFTAEEELALNHGMSDAEIEAANAPTGTVADEDFDNSDPFGDEPEAPADPSTGIESAPATKVEIIHDTLTPVQTPKSEAPKSEVLSDESWLETLPIYRVLKAKTHRAIVVRRAALDWRKLEKSISIYSRGVASAESVKGADNNPFARALSAPRTITSPENWGICAPCAGNGCERCGRAGFEMSGGIDPRRVEVGEVEL